ncbi:hypothetical protein [Mycolicibacterium goodii]|uniref:hypothetical protein n=1 Tax=Mycolicibacterium goodii TaxID=134601 RepID=UPI000AD751CB
MTFTDEQIAALLETLGLPADTDDPQLVVDTVADLAAQAVGMNPEQPSTVAAAARRHGLELVDHDTHEALKRDAAILRPSAGPPTPPTAWTYPASPRPSSGTSRTTNSTASPSRPATSAPSSSCSVIAACGSAKRRRYRLPMST